MQISILISGILAAILFILSGIFYFFSWETYKVLAISFLGTAIIMFILMIIRNAKEYWVIGGNKPKNTDK
jgi:hypothetical protein